MPKQYRQRKRYEEQRDIIIARAKARYRRVRDAMTPSEVQAWREKMAAHSREWRKQNQNRSRELGKRRMTRVQFRIANIITKAIARCRKAKGVWSGDCFIDSVVGLTRAEFLEQFPPNGKSIDHKVPCSAFDMTNVEHFLRAHHWTNLDLKTRSANSIKGNKWSGGIDLMALPCAVGDKVRHEASLFIKFHTSPPSHPDREEWKKNVRKRLNQKEPPDSLTCSML